MHDNISNINADIWQLYEILNTELTKLLDWFRTNKLSLNVKKTNYILFGNKHIPVADPLNLFIGGNLLQRVEYTKFVGVLVDKKLNWKKHFDHIAQKISKGLGAMGRLRNIVPTNVLVTLYHTLIYPYLSYCNIIWGSAAATSLHRLVILQNRAVRLVSLVNFRSSCDPLFLLVSNCLNFAISENFKRPNLCSELSIIFYHCHACVMSRFFIPIVPMIHVKSPTSVFMGVARLLMSVVLIYTDLGCGILSQLIFRMQFLLFRLKDYYCTIFVAFTSQVVINLVTVWHEMFAAPKVRCVLVLDISLMLNVCCFPWSKIKYYTTCSINEDFFRFTCT